MLTGGAAVRLTQDETTGDWLMFWPCARCGGATVVLFASVEAADPDELIEIAQRHVQAQPCPGCVTRASRSATDDTPAAWYDTEVREWVVRLPRADGRHALARLEIRWYDAPLALVQAAAAQVIEHWTQRHEAMVLRAGAADDVRRNR